MSTAHSKKDKLFMLGVFAVSIFLSTCQKTEFNTDPLSNPPVNDKQSALTDIASPAEFIVDQSNTTLTAGYSYNIYLAPLGQEFRPTLHALDAIELKLDDASCSLSGGPGGSLKLNIREVTITGKIIATSQTVHFDNCFYGILRFNFPAFVRIIPGRVYVLEAVHVSENTSCLFMNEYPDIYSGGDFIMNGIVRPGKDLWFREGLYNFIAKNKEQVKTLGWENLVRRDGTTFKNKGDCLQYINKGY